MSELLMQHKNSKTLFTLVTASIENPFGLLDLDKNNKVLKEEFFEYSGPMALTGIHWDYKSTKNNKR